MDLKLSTYCMPRCWVLQATVFDVTLHAGDALYLPACWWHAVSGGDGPNISFIHW